MKKFLQKNSGFSLIEMLIYVSLISAIFILVISTLFSYTRSYHEITALRAIDQTGITAMERMTRDIRNATSVDSANSSFGVSNGVLTILQTTGSVSTTTKFYLQNNVLKVNVNGTYSGPLSVSNSSVTNLTFTLLSSTVSQAVKIDMTVVATSTATTTRTKLFHSTIILKGSY